MKSVIYKMEFTTPVHFGLGSLSDAGISFCADTLFSALYTEALKEGKQDILYQRVKEGGILFPMPSPTKARNTICQSPWSTSNPRMREIPCRKRCIRN